jgi:hypothetical protein
MREARIDDTGEKLFTTATIAGLIVFLYLPFNVFLLLLCPGRKPEAGEYHFQLVLSYILLIYDFITVNGLRLFGVE